METIPRFMRECRASLLVTDFSPLREVKSQKEEISKRVGDSVSIHEVDAHNVVPIWAASTKLEYSAKTIRGKIHKLLSEFLIEFPKLPSPSKNWAGMNPFIGWDRLIADVLRLGFILL